MKVIEQEAVARGMDIVMFGHTHRPVIIVEDNITLINPGSISYPRQADGIPTYIILEINDNNEFNFELKMYRKPSKIGRLEYMLQKIKKIQKNVSKKVSCHKWRIMHIIYLVVAVHELRT